MLRKLALSSLISFGIAGSAHAATYYSDNFGDITPSFDILGSKTVGTGAFVYDFFFSASSSYVGSVTVADMPSVVAQNGQRYNITDLTLSLWLDNGTTVGVKDAGDTQLPLLISSADYISTETPGIGAAGNYFFEVTGIGAGTSGGRLSYTASATAVPEPQSYAMLLAGLCTVGFLARRRRG